MIWTTIITFFVAWSLLVVPILFGLMRSASRADELIEKLESQAQYDGSFAKAMDDLANSSDVASPRKRKKVARGFWDSSTFDSKTGSFTVFHNPHESQ